LHFTAVPPALSITYPDILYPSFFVPNARFVSDLFYDGKNSDSSAELRVKVTQLSTSAQKSKPGTVFDVFAAVGGFATILFPLTTLLKNLLLAASREGCFSLCENIASLLSC